MQRILFSILISCAWVRVDAQSLIDLRTQAKNVDFSAAPFTRPVKVGSGLPQTCGSGDLLFRIDAAPGENLYGCTAPNTWTQMSSTSPGSGGSDVTYSAGPGILLTGQAFGVDYSTVPGLVVSNTWSNLNDFSLGSIRVQVGSGTPSPGLCGSSLNVGKLYVRSDAQAANSSAYVCAQTGSGVYSWELMQAGSSGGTGNSGSGSGSTSMTVTEDVPLGGCNSASWVYGRVAYNGPYWNQHCTASPKLGYIPMALSQGTGDYFVYWTTVPSGITGTLDATLTAQVDYNAAGTYQWSVSTACPGLNAAIGSLDWNTGVTATVTSTGAPANEVYQWTFSQVSLEGCSAGQPMAIKFARGSGSQDLVGQNMEVMGATYSMTRSLP